MRKIIYFVFLIAWVCSCNNSLENKKVPVKKVVETDTLTNDEGKMEHNIDSNAIALQLENFEKLYKLNGGSGVIMVDSVNTDSLIITYYNTLPKNPGRHDHPYLWFTIYHFKEESKATDFFNDLKTQELVLPFGINKRPKNLLLNGDKVIWHQMEHSYGHHYQEYLENFKLVMKLDASANNLDSLLGFAYCSCRYQKADLKPLLGKWKVKLISTIHTERKPFYSYFTDTSIVAREAHVVITSDSIIIDYMHSQFSNEPWATLLPDSYFYMKYRYIQAEDYQITPKDSIKSWYSSEFIKECRKIQTLKQPIIEYQFNLKNRTSATIFQLANKHTYMVEGNSLFRLTRH